MSKNNILAVIVTYNRLDMLRKSVECMIQQTHPCDVLIVDNASTDDTAGWAGQFTPFSEHHQAKDDSVNIFYVNTGSNLGGAGGFNQGMRLAVEAGYDYVWVLDDDAFAEPDCLKELMNAADQIGTFGFLASAVMWKDGSLCRMNWQRKYPTPKERSERHLVQSDLTKEKVEVQSSTFVSTLFPAEIIRKVGLPIKEFFIWCDDIEYTRRIVLNNHYPSYVIPASRITHFIKNNEGTNLASDDPERIDRYNYAFRNENYMYRQYGIKGFLYYLLVIAYNTFRVLTVSKNNRLKRLKVIYKNLFTGLKFNPPVEYPKVREPHR